MILMKGRQNDKFFFFNYIFLRNPIYGYAVYILVPVEVHHLEEKTMRKEDGEGYRKT